MKNSFELVVSFYALQKLGAFAVWINAIYRKSEAGFVLDNSGGQGGLHFLRVGRPRLSRRCAGFEKRVADLEKSILVGAGTGGGVFSFDSLIESGGAEKFPPGHIYPGRPLDAALYLRHHR